MSEARLFRRIGRAGLIVLAGQVPTIGEDYPGLAHRLLEHVDLGKPVVALLGARAVSGEVYTLLDDLEDLVGMPVARLIPEEVPFDVLAGSGMVLLLEGEPARWVQAMRSTPEIARGVLTMLDRDGLLLAAGGAAGAMGTWALEGETVSGGLAWLPGAMIVPGVDEPAEVPAVIEVLQQEPLGYALGLPAGAVLALGVGGSLETWGEARPTLVLGKGWREA